MLVDVRRVLGRRRLIGITTTGRRTGRPRRIEIVAHTLDERIYLSGRPGPRDWYANLLARPELTLHLRGGAEVDVPARARPITELDERRRILEPIARGWGMDPGIMLARSPLVEIMLDDPAGPRR
jgi:deazaflavin-dependent oxidoreductase (nitroreductase family)